MESTINRQWAPDYKARWAEPVFPVNPAATNLGQMFASAIDSQTTAL